MSKKKQRAKEILRQATPEEIKAAIDNYFSRKPLLTPRLKNWEEDLPGNSEKQVVPGRLMQVTEINDTWMEVPRYENIMWGGAWVGIIAMIIPTFLFIWGAVDLYPLSFKFDNLLMLLLFLFFSFSMILLNLRMALFVPRDQPIRFNRKRQKIYIFEHHRKAWNPWVKWPTTVRVYDWADVHGEISRETDRYDQGFRLYGAVCKPGTSEVSERFILNRAVFYIEHQRQLWSHWCRYMQHQPVVMDPLYPNHHDDGSPRRKVRWPEALDIESRTAPE
ncbi:DUF6708 domain-containing protein [Intestinirhabdus alba]|uniref:DUF6708 domain-containing protein n=1 Tax=Intestinirhabdus alba TaxID=2899544 RepID=A0A6L6IW21_9ENTR|nr:DUF6708 domain-containing protein [Intestinirhabdus alba]MTH48923.1 hypothetical protein [Intestinirhabdus alba]